MNFWHTIRVVRQRRWIILGIVAITLLVVLIAAPKPRVVYQASAYVSPSLQVMQGGLTTASTRQSSVPDRNVILSNLIILAQQGEVYDKARAFLEKSPEQQKQQLRALVGPDVPDSDLPPRTTKPLTTIMIEPGRPLRHQDWSNVLEVTPVRNETIGEKGTTTDIIRLTVKMPNGHDTPFIVNAVALAFAETYQDKSRMDTRTYEHFLKTSKQEAKERLEELRHDIAEYKDTHDVVSIDAETASAIASIAELRSAQITAEAAVREAEAAASDVSKQLYVQPLVTDQLLPSEMNPRAIKLEEQLLQSEVDLRLISQRYKPAHELYKAAELRIKILKEKLAEEGPAYTQPVLNEIHQGLLKKSSDAQYALATARAKLESVEESFDQAKERTRKLSDSQPRYAELMTEYVQAEATYKMLSEKHDQAVIAEKEFTRTGSIVPYGWAHYSQGPIVQGPSKRSLLVYGFVLSLLVGVLAAVWLDSIDNRMRSAHDVEKMLDLPILGVTPQLVARDGILPRLTYLYPASPMAESFRMLRTNILFALRDNPFHTLMIATGMPGQGATTTICNLAIALAQSGKRIILIDADMRKPSLHKFFDTPNVVGLSALLSGEGSLAEALNATEVENLFLIPGGNQPLNPSELLGSKRMQELVDRLKDHCDLVLFDTPSAVVFSDAPMLASRVDAALMVVSANQIPRETEVQARDLIKKAKANIIGVAINKMSADNIDSCHFYTKYYSDTTLPAGGGPISSRSEMASSTARQLDETDNTDESEDSLTE
ncbi:MAG: polysaccharide biosynthesis tyrosine autokinase [Armatimonadetes bacterium]|nr:polysaccharide biosynthesis tyrosine autokinase [Armatimonadota bacterium]